MTIKHHIIGIIELCVFPHFNLTTTNHVILLLKDQTQNEFIADCVQTRGCLFHKCSVSIHYK